MSQRIYTEPDDMTPMELVAAAFATLPHEQGVVIYLSLTGSSLQHIAKHSDLSIEQVTKFRSELAKALAPFVAKREMSRVKQTMPSPLSE